MPDKKVKGTEINPKELYDYFFSFRTAINNITHIAKNTELKEDIKTFLETQQDLESKKLTLKEAHCLINELQKLALKIWKELLNSSLKHIGFNEIVGIEELYNYQKAFREFEEVLYGSVRYRDHINHCINLYLMGEMLFREKLKYEDLMMYTTADSKNKNDDKSAIFCIIAMTHDLGYPIEVIHSTNEKYREMFSHYKNIKLIEPAVDFPLSYHGIFDYLIDILSLAIRPKTEPKTNSSDPYSRKHRVKDGKIIDCIEIKSIRQTQHLRPFISTALLEYNHGLFSCMKLIEHLEMFKEDYDITFDDLKSYKGKEIDEKFLICQEILKTIIYHSTENIRTGIRDEKILYLWFNLLDDLCEWSRFTMGEGYTKIPGFCTPYVKEFNMKKVEIEFKYDEEYPDYVKPYKLFETIARKYYQIIKKVGTNIIITIKDIEDNRTFKFEYKPNDSDPFDFKIDRIKLDSDGILKKIISKEGLSECFSDKSKRC